MLRSAHLTTRDLLDDLLHEPKEDPAVLGILFAMLEEDKRIRLGQGRERLCKGRGPVTDALPAVADRAVRRRIVGLIRQALGHRDELRNIKNLELV